MRAVYLSVLLTLSMLAPIPAARAATWTKTAAGTYSWDDPLNWGGAFPNSNTDVGGINVNIAGDITINLNQAITVSQLNFGDTAASPFNIVIAGNGGSLILDDSAGSPSLTSRNGFNVISANITLADPATITHTTAAGSLTISGNVTVGANQLSIGGAGTVNVDGVIGGGAGGLTKISAGTVTLSAANTYGGATIINNGTLRLTGGNDRLPTGTTVTLGNGSISGILDLNGNSQTIAGLLTNGGPSDQVISSDSAAAATLTLNIAGADTFGGFLGGTGANNFGLTKTGAGTLTLTAANTYAGGTVISAGTIAFSSLGNLGAGGITLDGGALQWAAGNTADISARTVTFAAGGATLDTNGNDVTLAGAVGNSGAGGLTKIGSGALTLGGANTYAGATNIQAGTVRLSGAADRLPTGTTVTLGSGTGSGVLDLNGNSQTLAGLTISGTGTANQVISSDLAAAATLTLSVAASDTFDGILGGTAANNFGLTKTGAGTLTLTGSNTYSGSTVISAGILSIAALANGGSASGIGAGTGVQLGGGGTLQYTGASAATDRSITLASGGGIINVSTSGTALTLNGAVTGTGPFTKTGAGTLVLAAAESYSGATNVRNGVLQLSGGSNRLPTGTTVTLGNGTTSGTLDLNGNSQTLAGLTTSGTGTANQVISSDLAAAATLTLSVAGTGTFAGTLGGAGANNFGLTKTGAGTLTLSGANTYAGSTIVSGGVLSVGSLTDVGTASGIGMGGQPLALIAGGTLQYTGADASTNRTVTLTAPGGGVFDVSSAGTTLTLTGAVSGPGGLTKIGAGTLVLSGAFSTTATQVKAGTLRLGSFSAPGPITLGNGTVSGTLDLGGFDAQLSGLATSGTGTANRVINSDSAAAATLILNGAGTFGGTLGGAGANNLGVTVNSLITLTGANTYTGVTSIVGGTLQVSTLADGGIASGIGAAAADSSNLVIVGATLQYTGSTASTNRGFNSQSGTIDVFNSGTTLTIGGVVTGTTLAKTGAGTLSLTGTNTYSGTTIVSGGVLVAGILTDAGTAGNIGAGTDINLGGGTLRYTGGGVSINRTVSLSSGGAIDVATAATNLTMSGVFSGSGGLTKAGAGTLTLTGSNTYDGATVINAGVLSVGVLANGLAASNLGDSSNAAANLSLNGGTLQYTGAAVSTDRLFALSTAGGTLDASGTGALTFANTGSIALNGSGPRTLTLAGGNTGANTIAGILGDNGGATAVTKTGTGTWALTGSNTYTGITTISDGVLSVSVLANGGTACGLGQASNAAGNLVLGGGTLQYTGGSVTIDRGATLNAGGGTIDVSTAATSLTVTGIIGGSGALTKAGAGTLTLSGANTYSGGTTITAGTLQIGAGGTAGSVSGNIVDNAALAFNRSDSITFAGNISGTGSLTKLGAAILTLTGDATHAGGTTVSAGTLQIGFGGTVGSLAGNVTNNAVLAFNRFDAVTFAGAISGSGALTKSGGGTLTLSGASSYAGATNIQLGTLQLSGGNDRLPIGTVVALGSGTNNGTLSLNGFSQTLAGLTTSGTGAANRVTNSSAAAATLTLDIAGTDTFAGILGNASANNFGLTKAGAGTLTLSGANTYTGATLIQSGTLALSGADRLSSATAATINSGAFLTTTGTQTFAGLSGGGSATVGGNLTVNIASGGNLFSGTIDGAGGLIKIGTGTLTLGGTASQTGGTTVSAGTLQIGNGGAAGSLAGNVTDNGVLAFNRSDDVAFAGTIGGTGAVTKLGGGKVTLSSANTYDGATNINAGVLSVAVLANGLTASGIGDSTNAAANLQFGGGTLQYTGGTVTIDRGATLTAGGGTIDVFTAGTTLTVTGTLTGAGALNKIGAGTLALTNAGSNYSGGTNINAGTLSFSALNNLGTGGITFGGGTLQWAAGTATDVSARTVTFGAGGATFDTNANNVTLAAAIGNGGAGGLTKIGAGTLTLNAVNTYTGDTNINAGLVTLGNGSALQSSTVSINVNDGLNLSGLPAATLGGLAGAGNLNFGSTVLTIGGNGASTNYSGILSGTGPLTKAGSGTLTLSGANTYSGALTVNGGTLLITNNQGFGNPGAGFNIGAAGTLQIGGIVQRAIAGSGTVSAQGTLVIGQLTTQWNFAGTVSTGGNTIQLLSLGPAKLGSQTTLGAGGRLATLDGALLGGGLDGVTVDPTKLLTLTGGTGSVQGAFTNNGQINVLGGGQLVFADLVKGGGGTTGTVVYNGGYSPGNSPASVSAGDVILGAFNTLTMELGGTTQGSQYDHITVAGTLSANGALNVTTINGFNPTAGQSFDLFDGTTTGTFSSVALPTLSAGLTWDTSQLYSTGIISVSPVPEPAAVLAASLAGLLVWRCLRRRLAPLVRQTVA